MAENAKQTGGAMVTPQTGQNVADLATPTGPTAPAAGTAVNAGGTDDVQSKIDEALKAARKKWDAELETRLSEAISESERLAKLNADERAEAERQKEQEKFEKERAKYEREKLEFETGKSLMDKGLSPQFASFLAQDNAETTKANIDAFEKAFNEEVQAAGVDKLKGTVPKAGTDKAAAITQEAFNKMSYAERVKLYNEDKETYEKLTGGNQ